MSRRQANTCFLLILLLVIGMPLLEGAGNELYNSGEPALFLVLFSTPAEQAAVASLPNTDSSKLAAVASETVKAVADLDGYRQAYINRTKASGGTPDPSVLQRFDGSRQLAILGGMYKLRRTVTPASWQQIRARVNGPLKAKVGPVQ